MNLGIPEILVVVLIILILFGPDKIPELSRAIGRGMREFKKAMKELEGQIEEHAAPIRDAAEGVKKELNAAADSAKGGVQEINKQIAEESAAIAEKLRRGPDPSPDSQDKSRKQFGPHLHKS